jgi:hypothetical protein
MYIGDRFFLAEKYDELAIAPKGGSRWQQPVSGMMRSVSNLRLSASAAQKATARIIELLPARPYFRTGTGFRKRVITMLTPG